MAPCRGKAVQPLHNSRTWLPVEERLCNHCTTAEPETELHFLTKRYKNIKQLVSFPKFEPLIQAFKDLSDESRLPVLLVEDAESCELAAHYIAACHKLRNSVWQTNQSAHVLYCILIVIVECMVILTLDIVVTVVPLTIVDYFLFSYCKYPK